jgi:hypothetical protein
MDRACIIGAGSSGIASCQALHARGIPFDCFEAGSAVGGNWRYGNDNGMSSAYRSLHANSSRRAMQYAAFPMPDNYPDYLGHQVIAGYLDDFVDNFGFRGSIQFRTEVTRAEPAPGGGWDVTVRHRDTGVTRTGATVLSWSPTAIIGTRATRSRPFPAPRLSRAGRFIPTVTGRRSPLPASASWSWASATPPAMSPPIAPRLPRGHCSRCGAAPTSCRNTCSGCPPIT